MFLLDYFCLDYFSRRRDCDDARVQMLKGRRLNFLCQSTTLTNAVQNAALKRAN